MIHPTPIIAQILADGGISEWLGSAWSIAQLVLGFSVVIFVHELGHFLAAKWAGVRVDQFAIGFGHAIVSCRKGLGWRFRSTEPEFERRIDEFLLSQGKQPRLPAPAEDADKNSKDEPPPRRWDEVDRSEAMAALHLGETEYRLNWMPLGGYVKMLGQEDFVVDKSGELKVRYDPRSFTNKPVGKRMIIISAGVVMNLFFAAIIFGIVQMVGRYQTPAIIGEVVPGSAAARAGLLAGDRVVSVNGKTTKTFNDLTLCVVLADQDALRLDIERNGKPLVPPPVVYPEYIDAKGVRQMGVGPAGTLRVILPSLQHRESPRPDDIQEMDELSDLIVNGEPKKCSRFSEFVRAMLEARGRPIKAAVNRPKDKTAITPQVLVDPNASVDSTRQLVRLRAVWAPVSYEPGDPGGGSLLGLVPRITISWPIDPERSFDKAGAKSGDVIKRIGNREYPTYKEVTEIIESGADREIPLFVRRARSANNGLTAEAVDFCADHRKSLIAALLSGDPSKAIELAQAALNDSLLPASDHAAILDAMQAATDPKTASASSTQPASTRHPLLVWLENVEVHELTLKPVRPWALLSSPPPKIDATLRLIDENHLVVADVLEKLGDRTSPAYKAGIPRGAVILAADDQPMRHWHELSEHFRAVAGKTVKLTYRLADQVQSKDFQVPDCLPAALDLGIGARVVSIDGKTSAKIKSADGKFEYAAQLPDWRTAQAILKNSIGKTVSVDYTTLDGESRTGSFPVTPDNTDPWLDRISYAFGEPLLCYPLFERHPISNPIVAVAVGFQEAYDATIRTVQSLRHMVFTGKLAKEKVSGPVGILRQGKERAGAGIIELLFFLALISANLAVVNFLPMPIVDGGLFLFLVLEKIRGEPVSIKTQVATQLVGIALIATLFILITYQDIVNWITGT